MSAAPRPGGHLDQRPTGANLEDPYLCDPRRINWQLVLGIALFLASTGGAVAFWSATSDTREVLVATRDLRAGARLAEGHLTLGRARLNEAMYAAASWAATAITPDSRTAGKIGRAGGRAMTTGLQRSPGHYLTSRGSPISGETMRQSRLRWSE